MKTFDWDDKKNQWLKNERHISFEEILFYIMNGNLVDVVFNKNQEKYSGQRIFVVNVGDYIYLVPFEETEDSIILKTIIPSRKATRDYLGGK